MAGTAGDPILYLVATPIGNLDDLSVRAVTVLRDVELIAAEDTRHARPLLQRHGITTPLIALHEHNERAATPGLVARLQAGDSIALISDAGTPLISDPGLPLVRAVREAGIRVVPVPGPCAAIAALSASGLAVNRFAFEGFPPRTSSARRRAFEALRGEQRTLVFYESSHRVRDTVGDLQAVFQPGRRLVVARELTKLFETIVQAPLAEATRLFDDPNMLRGEFVLMLEPPPDEPSDGALTQEQERVLRVLLGECSVRTAVRIAAEISGGARSDYYRRALELNASADND